MAQYTFPRTFALAYSTKHYLPSLPFNSVSCVITCHCHWVISQIPILSLPFRPGILGKDAMLVLPPDE